MSTDAALYGDEFAPGALVGSYLIEAQCHQGVFASVYRAREVTGGRPVALKVMRRQFAAASKYLERFEREAEVLSQLRHPNIVEILEYGALHSGRPFIAMEWLAGRNLHDELRHRGHLSAGEALAVVEEVGAALAVAHARGIVHRDLKAENVMALPRPVWFTVKLVDFGIAKLMGDDLPRNSALTSTGALVGTPVAMAPEQIRREPLDARTDIYALGLLLYQLVTGRLPFPDLSAVELEEMHLYMPPPRASALAPVSPAFDAVILKCLEKQPMRRYAAVDELLAELRRAVASEAAAPALGRQAIALYVEARIDPELEQVPDRVLAEVDAVCALARRVCEQAQLATVVASSNGLLAAAPLPVEATAERNERARVLAVARRLAAELDGTLGMRGAVRATLTLHVAGAEVRGEGAGAEFAGGDLFRLSEWAARDFGGLFATGAALAGLEGSFVACGPDLFRVVDIPSAR